MKFCALFVAVFFLNVDHQASLQNDPFLKSYHFCSDAAAESCPLLVKLKCLVNLIAVSLAIELLYIPCRSCRMCSHDDLLVSFSGMEKDAVAIFTRFISPDAVRPIPITEQIRNDIVGERLFLICGRFVFCWHAVLRSPFSALVCAAKICGEDGMVDPNCFVIAQAVVKAILEDQ